MHRRELRRVFDLAIIIPTYNVANYIGATLDSIAKQSIAPQQIIIVDDGSTDSTVTVIQQHPLFASIQLVEQANQGQGIARNVGIAAATTEYLYLLDSDDLLMPHFIADIKAMVQANERPDLLMFSGESFQDDGYTADSFNPTSYTRPFVGFFAQKADFYQQALQHPELSCSPCLYVSKRSLWQQHKLTFNHYFHEDEELFYRLLFAAQHVYLTQEIYFLRRIRAGSTMTMQKQPKHVRGLAEVLRSLLILLKDNGNSVLQTQLLRRRLRRFSSSYVRCCKEANAKIDYALLWQAVKQIRNIRGYAGVVRAFVK